MSGDDDGLYPEVDPPLQAAEDKAEPGRYLPMPCECDAECFEPECRCFCGCHALARLSPSNRAVS